MSKLNNILLAMISIRIMSAIIELTAALLMYHFGHIKTAIRINAILGIIGPIILILVTFLGLIEISHNISFKKTILIALGVLLIILGSY